MGRCQCLCESRGSAGDGRMSIFGRRGFKGRDERRKPVHVDLSVHYSFVDCRYEPEWIKRWCAFHEDEDFPIKELTFSGSAVERPNLLPLLRRHLNQYPSSFLNERIDPLGGPGLVRQLTLESPLGSYSSPGLFSLLAAQNRPKPYGFITCSHRTSLKRMLKTQRRTCNDVVEIVAQLSPLLSLCTALDFKERSLTREDIRAISEILQAENPFPLLHPRLGTGFPRTQPAQIARMLGGVAINAIADLADTGDGDDDSIQFDLWVDGNEGAANSPCSFYVMDDDPRKPTVDVLVPGYGVCSVDRAKLHLSRVSERVLEAPSSPASSKSVPGEIVDLRISLSPCSDEETGGVVPFIELLGHRLRTLSISSSSFWVFVNDETLRDIVVWSLFKQRSTQSRHSYFSLRTTNASNTSRMAFKRCSFPWQESGSRRSTTNSFLGSNPTCQ